MATLGLQLTQKEGKLDRFLKKFCMLTVVVTSIQCILFISTVEEIDNFLASAFTIGLVSIQGCFKFASIVLNFEKLKRIKKTLSEWMVTLKVEEDPVNVKKLKNFRKTTKLLQITNVSCIWIFNVTPIVSIIISTLTGGEVVRNLVYAFYYPTDDIKGDYYYPAYIYEIIAGHTLTMVQLVTDGFFLLLVGQLACVHRTIARTFKDIIDEYEPTKRSVTVKKLKEIIELQNEVYNVGGELMKCYEYALLACALLQTGTICFIAFIVSVNLIHEVSYYFYFLT